MGLLFAIGFAAWASVGVLVAGLCYAAAAADRVSGQPRPRDNACGRGHAVDPALRRALSDRGASSAWLAARCPGSALPPARLRRGEHSVAPGRATHG